MKTKQVIIKTVFHNIENEYMNDIDFIVLCVPNDTTRKEISEKLYQAHEELLKLKLDNDGEEQGYTLGYNYKTLLDYVCKENDWTYKELAADMECNFYEYEEE